MPDARNAFQIRLTGFSCVQAADPTFSASTPAIDPKRTDRIVCNDIFVDNHV